MRGLSISAAWEETKVILARDGRLLATVALALVALPTAVNGLINPGGMNSSATPWWVDLIAVIASLIALAGQLSLIRLAIGPSITVGGSIVHGIRRLPIYFLAVILVILVLLVVAFPLALLLQAMGVPLDAKPMPASPSFVIVLLIYCAFVIFLGVRLILSSSVASAEDVGPIAILKRSWNLTGGYWWALFGFLAMFVVGAIIVLLAVGSAVGVIVSLLFGTVQPMSAAALVLALVQALVSAAITTLFAVMVARIYLQLSGRSEVQPSVPSSGI